jgi:hypothetical protein
MKVVVRVMITEEGDTIMVVVAGVVPETTAEVGEETTDPEAVLGLQRSL